MVPVNRVLALAMAMGAAVLGNSADATFFTLDTFTAGTTDLNITVAAPPTQSASETQTALSGVIGGSRYVGIEKISGLAGSTRNVTGAVDATNGQFAYISGNGVTGTLTLAYDGNGSGLNVQLDAALDSFLVNFVDGDYGPTRTIPVTMTITAMNDATGSLTQTLSADSATAPNVLEFAVSDFTNLAGLNLATNNVKKVQVFFAPAATSADFTLSSIQVVPEPSAAAMALAGLTCGGLMWWRRRVQA